MEGWDSWLWNFEIYGKIRGYTWKLHWHFSQGVFRIENFLWPKWWAKRKYNKYVRNPARRRQKEIEHLQEERINKDD